MLIGTPGSVQKRDCRSKTPTASTPSVPTYGATPWRYFTAHSSRSAEVTPDIAHAVSRGASTQTWRSPPASEWEEDFSLTPLGKRKQGACQGAPRRYAGTPADGNTRMGQRSTQTRRSPPGG